ncbi:hypothetical protein FXO38_26667, partial [Capsicum annuum]
MGRGRPRKNNTSAMVITAGGKVRTDKRNDPVGKMKEKAELEEELNSELEWPEVQVNRSFHSSPVGSAIAGLRTEHTVYQDTLYKVRACSTTLGGDLIVEKEIGESSKAQEQNRINTGGQRAWAGLFDANCLTAKGMNLTYIPPIIEEGEVMVQLEREDVVEGNTKWKQALIMYVVGNTPTIGAVERDEVLVSGPYTMASRPIILKAWTNGFNFHDEVLKTIPLWVKLPALPLNCWTNKALSKIGSALGNLIYADACTTNMEKNHMP